MSRSVALLLLVVFGAVPAAAQDAGSAGRYAFVPVEEGTLRLDTATGEVSLCTGEAGARACKLLPDEASADLQAAGLADRIAALESRIAALEAQRQSGELLTDEEAMDKVMVLADRMMRRFFGIVQDMKRDMEEEAL